MARPETTKIVNDFVSRSTMQQYKGKARDKAALEFLCGAAAAADALGNVPVRDDLLRIAFLVSIRGMAILEALDRPANETPV